MTKRDVFLILFYELFFTETEHTVAFSQKASWSNIFGGNNDYGRPKNNLLLTFDAQLVRIRMPISSNADKKTTF